MKNGNREFKNKFYKRLIRFSLEVIRFCATLRKERDFWVIVDQLVKSATSIGANVVEAQASASRKDYINFFQIALKSSNETKYWLILIKESNSRFTDEANRLLSEVTEISKIIGAGLITMKKVNK